MLYNTVLKNIYLTALYLKSLHRNIFSQCLKCFNSYSGRTNWEWTLCFFLCNHRFWLILTEERNSSWFLWFCCFVWTDGFSSWAVSLTLAPLPQDLLRCIQRGVLLWDGEREREWERTRGRDERRTGLNQFHLIRLNLPWRNRIGCICQTLCCALDCRTQRRGLLPNPAEKKNTAKVYSKKSENQKYIPTTKIIQTTSVVELLLKEGISQCWGNLDK